MRDCCGGERLAGLASEAREPRDAPPQPELPGSEGEAIPALAAGATQAPVAEPHHSPPLSRLLKLFGRGRDDVF